jgi:hypothetical protein
MSTLRDACRLLALISVSLVLVHAQDRPTVFYTGTTYGYLRSNDTSNPDSLSIAFDTTYRALIDMHPQAILVGTGDNFAPEYGARFDSSHRPIARVQPTGTPASTWVRTNAAVDFFVTRGYAAITPGQYDFYFGAEFLRQTGSVLPMLGANLVITTAKQQTAQQPLCAPAQLLLPNQVSLPVQSGSGQSGGKGKAGGQSGGGGGSGGGGSGGSSSGSGKGSSGSGQNGAQSAQACLQPPATSTSSSQGPITLLTPSAQTIYPWSTEFELSVPRTIDVHTVSLCRRVPGSRDYGPLNTCTDLISLGNPYPDGARTGSVIYRFDVDIPDFPLTSGSTGLVTLEPMGSRVKLLPDDDIGLCIADEKSVRELCTSLEVQRPFFSNAWVEVQRSNVKYVVFGAIDPAIQGLISNENASWNRADSNSTKINIADPSPSIEQMARAFKRLHSDDWYSWTWILLAEMPPPAAKALAATLAYHKFTFDALISAADVNQETADMNLSIAGMRLQRAPDILQLVPAPVITPHPIVQDFPKLPSQQITPIAENPLEVLEIEKTPTGAARYRNSTDNTSDAALSAVFGPVKRAFANACETTGFRPTLDALDHLSNQRRHLTGAACNDPSSFQCVSLQSMRDRLDADAAILQRRDFYASCAYEEDIQRLQQEVASSPPAQQSPAIVEAIERIFWNSAFLTRASVSGATLRVILQTSDAIVTANNNSTTPPLVPNRDLLFVGITKANGTYYIDGAAIDDSKVYSIATSDQLALGDSAYPQFAQIDLVSPDVFTGYSEKTYRLASLVGEPLLGHPPVELSRNDVMASVPWSAGQAVVANSNLTAKPSAQNPLQNAGKIELDVQRRSFFTLTLQQATAGYSFSKPNQSDANIGQNLAGVTNPNVAAPHSQSVSFNDNFRAIREWTDRVDWGLDEQLTYSKNTQGTLQPPATALTTPTGVPIPTSSVSLSANTLILSPFWEIQFHRYQPHWKLALRPGTVSSDISRNLQFLKTASKTEEYELLLQRQRSWQPSIGPRYEHDNLNFFEAGYIRQEATNVLSGLTVNGIFTPLTAGTTAATVTSKITPNPGDVAIPSYSSYLQNGGYWLGMFTQRLPHTKVVYQGITFGNFFAYGSSARTSTVLTRYAAEFSNSLQVPVWGNLSLAPGFNMFFFQDQSHQIGSSLIRKDLILQLNYLFDWHQGIAWGAALKGKSN